MDWINQLPFWIQILLGILTTSIVSAVIYLILNFARRNIKLPNIEIGSEYLTGEQIINVVENEVNTKIEQMTIELKKRPRDQMLYVDQICLNIKNIMTDNYKKLLENKKIKNRSLKELRHAYEMMTIIILQEQKEICLQYFSNINGSLNDVPMTELNDPDSQLNKGIESYSTWMIKKAHETINNWYLELDSGIDREKLYNDNLKIVPEILKQIQDALKTGHRIHIQYLDLIKEGKEKLKKVRGQLLKIK
jgi:hypothetical protein